MLRKLRWTAAPIALLAATHAHAAEVAGREDPSTADSAGAQVNEVVVTARKQIENVQTVGATVAVVPESRLVAQNIISFTDISKVLPTINIQQSPDTNQFSVTIRGIGTGSGNTSFDSSVATYLNGAFVSRDREFAAMMFDMSSLETISGTQAALLGKNSSLGVLNLVTTKPGDTFQVSARYGHEFELNSDRVEAATDIPLSSSFRVRLAGLYDSEGGSVKDLITGGQYRDRQWGGRVTAVWLPTDKVDVTALLQATTDNNNGPLAVTALPGVLAGSGAQIQAAHEGFPNILSSPFIENAQFSPALGLDRTQGVNTQMGILTANVQTGGGVLTSQTAYSASQSEQERANFSFLPGNGLLVTAPPDLSRQITQEVRYNASVGPHFDFIAGALLLYSQYKLTSAQSVDYALGATALPFALTGSVNTYFKQDDTAVSLFTQGNYHITDPLKLTVGLRYTRESKDADFARTTLTPGTYSTIISPPIAPISLSVAENLFDGSVGLNYQVEPHILIYGTLSQGSKAGGFAQSVSTFNFANAFYKPEIAQTAEVGIKSQFFDRALTVNVNAFHTFVRDLQLVRRVGANFVVVNQNVRSEGVESQVNWAPVRGVNFYWSNVYADARDPATGLPGPYSPKWAGLVGGTFQRDISNGFKADLDVNADYRTEEVSPSAVPGLPPLAPLSRLNISVGFGNPTHGWEVRLIGQNVTNQGGYYFDNPLPFIKPAAGAQDLFEFPIKPMTFKLQFSIKR